MEHCDIGELTLAIDFELGYGAAHRNRFPLLCLLFELVELYLRVLLLRLVLLLFVFILLLAFEGDFGSSRFRTQAMAFFDFRLKPHFFLHLLL